MDKQTKINTVIRTYCDQRYKLDKNVIKINVHNTIEHEIGKLIKSFELQKEGYEVYSEVIFKNGRRADLFTPINCSVYEILCSETKEEALSKTENYPDGLEIFLLESSDLIKVLK